jgi:5-methylcytosine-specific restriction endonuclease McrA
MAQEFAKKLYNSKAWQECRASYVASCYGVCEVCKLKGIITPGVILHHKKPLTPANINDVDVSLNHDNLIFMCIQCHNITHDENTGVIKRGLMFKDGDVVPREGKSGNKIY